MDISVQVLDMLDAAIKEYGTYSYYDKGAGAILHVGEIKEMLRRGGLDETEKTMFALHMHADGSELLKAIVEDFVFNEGWTELEDRLESSDGGRQLIADII